MHICSDFIWTMLMAMRSCICVRARIANVKRDVLVLERKKLEFLFRKLKKFVAFFAARIFDCLIRNYSSVISQKLNHVIFNQFVTNFRNK